MAYPDLTNGALAYELSIVAEMPLPNLRHPSHGSMIIISGMEEKYHYKNSGFIKICYILVRFVCCANRYIQPMEISQL
jgi:hypothetical protein